MTFYNTSSGKVNAIEFAADRPSSNDTLLCIHGFCCDARVFTYFGNKLSKEGYNVISIDLPGHGESFGEKGDLDDFDKCIKSIHQIVVELKKKNRGSQRIFIVSHSMGSIFALWYAHIFKRSINGLILLCPNVRVPNMKKRFDAEPRALEFLLLLFGRIFTPRRRLDITKVFPAYVKTGGDEVAWMMKDSKINFRYSFRFLVDVLALRNSKLSKLTDIGDIPVLILHGRKDRLMYLRVSEEFFKLLQTRNKEIKTFDCDHWFYHTIFFDQSLSPHSEQSRMQITSQIADWLRKFKDNGI